jgi:four helix bundle protein
VSIGANIAEGCGKMGNNEFQRFLQIAAGSASELDYEILLAKDLGYLTQPDYARIADELLQIRKMLSSLLRKVNVDRKG